MGEAGQGRGGKEREEYINRERDCNFGYALGRKQRGGGPDREWEQSKVCRGCNGQGPSRKHGVHSKRGMESLIHWS